MLSKLIDSFNEMSVKQQTSYKNIVFVCDLMCQFENFMKMEKKAQTT